MKSRAHIVMYFYFPAIILYMTFANDDVIWDKFYFIIEKTLLIALLFDYFMINIFRNRKNIAFALIVLQIMFILYILIDWDSSLRMDYITTLIASLLFIIALICNFYCHDRKGKG